MARKLLPLILTVIFTIGYPRTARALGGYEFYLFGVNLKTLQNCNWLQVAAGAATSLLVHELGHALYLETQGKKWDVELSASSGMAITFTDSLSARQYREFGRAGFALQAGIGLLLATMPATRGSDFTKGWVGINSLQLYTYRIRAHEHGDDFLMIEKGGGNADLDMGILAALSSYNLLQTEYGAVGLWAKPEWMNDRQQRSTSDNDPSGVFNPLEIKNAFK